MYNDTSSSFYKVVEAWRHGTANGKIMSELHDSNDSWSSRIILEGLLKFADAEGIKIITPSEAYDICFNNFITGGNLLYNPQFKNSAKDFMPTATVPSNPDGYIGECSVTKDNGIPILITTNETIYDHYGVLPGKYKFSGDIKGTGNILLKFIQNKTPFNDINSAETITTINISNNESFDSVNKEFIVPDNDLTAYEQLCAGYGEKVIGVRFIFSGGLNIKNISLTM